MLGQRPVNWGKDKLSGFAEAAFNNEIATYAHPATAGWHETLNELATLLTSCTEAVLQNVENHLDAIGRLLFVQAHSQYLAAARSASSGHCLATYPVGRSAIESAFYAWHLVRDQSAARRWLDKPTNKDELRQWGREFTVSNIASKVAALTDEGQKAAEWGKFLYQSAIDEGAHPNEQALFSNMKLLETQGDPQFQITFLHGHGLQFVNSAKFAVEVGMFILRMYELALPEVASKLGIAARNRSIAGMLTLMISNSSDLVADVEARSPGE
ncbi:hypothetical protein [Cupriavidus plantarum]|uniref:hypothetical protein n=1 Tax=Cupriavidus plantarum TaxID=942865 RepID=UPI000E23D630|nr:hypothetical protein [Cupriavidus plantarum]REE92627.1 hypothetical protein C7418_3897 [Cupriavidus plantarum]